MFNIFRDTIAKDLTKIADYFNGVADAGTIFKDKRALAVNRIKNAVLNGDIGGGGGVTPEIEAEIENAQWKTESSEQVFSETVTTVAEEGVNSATLSYAEQITADTLKITFNGVEYTCAKRQVEGTTDVEYGGTYNVDTEEFDFSEYPFILSATLNGNTITTETPGSYTVSASAYAVSYTDAFKEGVVKNSTFYVDFEDGDNGLVSNKTLSEIIVAYESGANVVARYYEIIYRLTRAASSSGKFTFSNDFVNNLDNTLVVSEIRIFQTADDEYLIKHYIATVNATVTDESGGGGGGGDIG